jgi:tetratricopeptide (TPR) repeat protein
MNRSRSSMKTLTIAFLLWPMVAVAQDAAQVRRMFEAGQYQQVIETADAAASPEAVYTAAQSYQKLGSAEEARGMYARLAERPDDDAWHFVGLSGQQLLNDQTDAALESARRATELAGQLSEVHYQLGLVLAKRQDWGGASAAFDRAVELNPSSAYAYYYGGLMYYRAGRPDRMANHFEQFLKLAPESPERPEVVQIMRTVRGR